MTGPFEGGPQEPEYSTPVVLKNDVPYTMEHLQPGASFRLGVENGNDWFELTLVNNTTWQITSSKPSGGMPLSIPVPKGKSLDYTMGRGAETADLKLDDPYMSASKPQFTIRLRGDSLQIIASGSYPSAIAKSIRKPTPENGPRGTRVDAVSGFIDANRQALESSQAFQISKLSPFLQDLYSKRSTGKLSEMLLKMNNNQLPITDLNIASTELKQYGIRGLSNQPTEKRGDAINISFRGYIRGRTTDGKIITIRIDLDDRMARKDIIFTAVKEG